MEITRRCDYACRILRAAYDHGDSYISIAEVADREDIPYSFARSIQHDLVKAGYLKTIRGVRGGLMLSCDPAKTTLYEVLEALQGPISVAPCTIDPDYCNKSRGCAFCSAFGAADSLLKNLFEKIYLADLFEQGDQHPAIVQAMAAE